MTAPTHSLTPSPEQVADLAAQVAAIDRVMAVIEFDLDGTIRTANENFLGALGYSLADLEGQHHRLFVSDEYAASPEYATFWQDLALGAFRAGEFQRFGRGGREVWIQASYNPIIGPDGCPYKVVKFATDITAQVRARIEAERMADELSDASTTLGAVATQLSAATDRTLEQATRAAAAGEQVNQSIQSVAVATEEMANTVNEISQNAGQAANAASTAVGATEAASTAIRRLGESGEQIGDVVKLISSIAQQTNLLALNATIEAARAGEAGKGFAVVASEVKELSKETGEATRKIAAQIKTIRDDTDETVRAIEEISTVVAQVSEIANSIAAAVEQQSVTTNDISATLTEAAAGTDDIARTVTDVSDSAQSSKDGVDRTLEAAGSLDELAQSLSRIVESLRT